MKNPLSLEGLRDWLRAKPADAKYNWLHPRVCLLGQYYNDIGAQYVASEHWWDVDGKQHNMPSQFLEVALAGPTYTGPFTYGAALERAEKLIASQ